MFEQLRPLQRKGALAAVSNAGFLLLFEQRTGKTWISLAVIEMLQGRDGASVLLIVPKTNLESTWVKQLREHLPQFSIFHTFDEFVAHQKAFKKAWGHEDNAVLLMNYEALPGVVKRIKRRRWTLIVYDEIQRLKARASRNARMAKTLVRCSDHRLGLTGTPIDKTPVDLYSIMRFIDPDVLGGTWKEFEEEYIEPVNIDLTKVRGVMAKKRLLLAKRIRQSKPTFKDGALEAFYRRVGPFVMRVTQEDMGIEKARIHRIPVGMFGRQRRLYEQLERSMVVTVGKKTIIAPLKIVQRVKLQQLTGGFIYDEDKRLRVIGAAKERKLEVLIKRLPTPLAIFAKFKPEVEMAEEIARDYSDRVALIWGKVKDTKKKKHRTEILEAFQRGEIDYIICQQRTGGVGVDLYRARNAIVYSMGHSYIDYSQMVARLTYLDQNSPADFYVLYVPDTIDEDILTAIDEKRSVSEVTLERLKRQRR